MYPNNETGRKAYDRHQMSSLPTLLPGLDPDPPVLLCARTSLYDATILAQLRQHGWPGTGQNNKGAGAKSPKAIKAITLARKIAKSSDLSDVAIRLLAERIAWLMRNHFRWRARDGYAALAAAKASQAAENMPTKSSPSAPQQTAARIDPKPQKVFDSSPGDGSSLDVEPASSKRVQGSQSTPVRTDRPNLRVDKSDGSAGVDDLFDQSPALDRCEGLLAELGGGGEAACDYHANDVGEAEGGDDDRSSTAKLFDIRTPYIEHLPQAKARALLLAIDHKEAEESLRRKAHTLLADKDELSAALSASDSLAQDISDACAALGIDLPC